MRLDDGAPAIVRKQIGDALPQRRPTIRTLSEEGVQRPGGVDGVTCRRGEIEYVITDRHAGARSAVGRREHAVWKIGRPEQRFRGHVQPVGRDHARQVGRRATKSETTRARSANVGVDCADTDIWTGGTVRLSTRNQLPGTVESVQTAEAMAIVKVILDGGHPVTASITREAVDDLQLAKGTKVTVLVKSTEVMLAVE